jgi:hypothetical protein
LRLPPAEKGQTYWRFANFLFPFRTQTPQGPFDRVNTRAWVPMDDTHTMFVSLSWRGSPASMRPLKNGQMGLGSRLGFDYLPNTTEWYRRWRLSQNPSNDWMVDRVTQKTESSTGIASIYGQDQAVTESMCPITDHEFENLEPNDIMIARTRRRLLRAARAFKKDGTVPPCVDEPGIYTQARSGDFVTDAKIAWRDAYEMQMRTEVRPLQQAAE